MARFPSGASARERESGLTAFDPDSYKTYAGDKGEGAEDGRDWEGVLRLVGDLDRSEVDILLLMGEGDASGGKSDDGQENEQSSDDGGWFHFDGDVPFMRLRARCGVRCVSYCKSMPCSAECVRWVFGLANLRRSMASREDTLLSQSFWGLRTAARLA